MPRISGRKLQTRKSKLNSNICFFTLAAQVVGNFRPSCILLKSSNSTSSCYHQHSYVRLLLLWAELPKMSRTRCRCQKGMVVGVGPNDMNGTLVLEPSSHVQSTSHFFSLVVLLAHHNTFLATLLANRRVDFHLILCNVGLREGMDDCSPKR